MPPQRVRLTKHRIDTSKGQRRQAPGNRRTTKACARCRQKKIKCDFGYPTCTPCAHVRLACMGYDAAEGVERPRSIVAHLENQVAVLELELAALKNSEPPSTGQKVYDAIDTLTNHLSAIIGNPSGLDIKSSIDDEPSLVSHVFLSQSPPPALCSDSESPRTTKSPSQSTTISLVPRHVINIMLKNYCSIYLPQYPAIEEADLYESCERIFSGNSPTHYDLFSVAIALAISANTLMRCDEQRAMTAAEGFWATAFDNLRHVGKVPLEKLQALLLLAHYGLLNPQLVNCCNCTAAATRYCLQLGLHDELADAEKQKLTHRQLNTRRRLFWVSYLIDANIHSAIRRPFPWPKFAISVESPTYDAALSPGTSISSTTHAFQFREIEAEITLRLYHPSIPNDEHGLPILFEDWYRDVQAQLDQWYEAVLLNQDLARTIEFHNTMYWHQVLRLNRPSRLCPNPSIAMRRKSTKSALRLMDEVSNVQRMGKLFYIFHNAHIIVDSGLSLLESMASCSRYSEQKSNHLDDVDLPALIRTVRSLPVSLRKMARKWPCLYSCANALEKYSKTLIKNFEQWADGNSSYGDDTLVDQLQHHLLGFQSGISPQTHSLHGSPVHTRAGKESIDQMAEHPRSRPYQVHMQLASTSLSHTQPTLEGSTWAATLLGPNSPGSLKPRETIEPPSVYDNRHINDPNVSDSCAAIDHLRDRPSDNDFVPWGFYDIDADEIFAALLDNKSVMYE